MTGTDGIRGQKDNWRSREVYVESCFFKLLSR